MTDIGCRDGKEISGSQGNQRKNTKTWPRRLSKYGLQKQTLECYMNKTNQNLEIELRTKP